MPDIANYPLTLPEVKSFLRIDSDYAYEDDLLQMLVISETLYYEKRLNLGLVAGTDRVHYVSNPYCCGRNFIRLNYAPVQADSIKAFSHEAAIQGENLIIQQLPYPIVFGVPYMGCIQYKQAGLSPFPEDLKRAILMRIAFAYDNRTGKLDSSVKDIYAAVNPDTLAAQYSRNF